MLTYFGLSMENYCSTLIASGTIDFAADTLKPNVTLEAFDKAYCMSKPVYDSLSANLGWTIDDLEYSAVCHIPHDSTHLVMTIVIPITEDSASQSFEIPATGSGYYYFVD